MVTMASSRTVIYLSDCMVSVVNPIAVGGTPSCESCRHVSKAGAPGTYVNQLLVAHRQLIGHDTN